MENYGCHLVANTRRVGHEAISAERLIGLTGFEKQVKKEQNQLTNMAIGVSVFYVLVFVLLLASDLVGFQKIGVGTESVDAARPFIRLNEWGDLLAGLFAPLAFLWLVVGYYQQGQEMKAQVAEFQEFVKASKEQTSALALANKMAIAEQYVEVLEDVQCALAVKMKRLCGLFHIAEQVDLFDEQSIDAGCKFNYDAPRILDFILDKFAQQIEIDQIPREVILEFEAFETEIFKDMVRHYLERAKDYEGAVEKYKGMLSAIQESPRHVLAENEPFVEYFSHACGSLKVITSYLNRHYLQEQNNG